MTIRQQIMDVLENLGPKKVDALVGILEDFDPKNKSGKNGVHPVKAKLLEMLNEGTLILTADRYLKILE